MIRRFLAQLFSSSVVVATSDRIRGNMSQGRQDKPGVWWKA